MSEPQGDGLMTRRDFLKKTGWAALVATGASLLSPFFKSTPKVEGRADVGDLSHKANILETDNTLGVENPVAQFQIECKGQKLSTFVFTDLDESGFPKIFTEYKGKTVELLKDRTDNDDVSWYIPGTDVPEGGKGLEGIVGAEYVLMHQDKYQGNNDSLVRYWPPSDGKGQSVGFNYETEVAYRFDASELPDKVQGLLFGELR